MLIFIYLVLTMCVIGLRFTPRLASKVRGFGAQLVAQAAAREVDVQVADRRVLRDVARVGRESGFQAELLNRAAHIAWARYRPETDDVDTTVSSV